MRVLIFLSLLCASVAVSGALRIRQISLRTDHFNPLDQSRFESRYFVNSEFYSPGGPIFIYVSGSFEVYDDFLSRGNVYDIARETGGHLFSLEHRFLGTSRPTPDTSTQNLRLLSPQQVRELIKFKSS
jgi:thymus-specific serine protease